MAKLSLYTELLMNSIDKNQLSKHQVTGETSAMKWSPLIDSV
ncbi:hypothetical protein [Bacillus sp. WMMC1349]|nr:hypothetical protein [Bacillus sp. WMMC1349]